MPLLMESLSCARGGADAPPLMKASLVQEEVPMPPSNESLPCAKGGAGEAGGGIVCIHVDMLVIPNDT